MEAPHFQFVFEGENARQAAQELQNSLQEEFPDWPVSQNDPIAVENRATKSAEVALAIIAVVLQIPSAVKDISDYRKEAKLKTQLQGVIEGADNAAQLVMPGGLSYQLNQMQAAQVMDIIKASENTQVQS